jgi:aminoglycoside phosphotransferase (APT) family kinase protein
MIVALPVSLERHLQTIYPGATVTDFSPISDGWETEVFRFTLTHNGSAAGLILRMYPGQDATAKCPREFETLRKLYEAGYPVPEVLYHTTDAQPTGKPFLIMRLIEGQPLGKLFMTAAPERLPRLMRRFAELFVQLHRLNVYPFIPDDTPKSELQDPYAFIRSKLRYFQHMLDQHQRPEFQPVLAWLEAQIERVPCPRLALIHYDFHPFNVLYTPDERAFVIDWGTAEAADYRVDLGWSLMLAASHGQPGQREAMLAEYEAVSGQPVENLDVFEVLACLRRLFSVRVSMNAGAGTLGMRPEAVETMRAQGKFHRIVYDMLVRNTGIPLPEIDGWLKSLNA